MAADLRDEIQSALFEELVWGTHSPPEYTPQQLEGERLRSYALADVVGKILVERGLVRQHG